MKSSGVLAAAAAAAVLARANPPGRRQGGSGELVTATLYAGYDAGPEAAPAETLALRAPGTTAFRTAGYAQVCAVTHEPACEAYALLDGRPNLDGEAGAAHPDAGARARPLFIRPAPAFAYKLCVSQQGETTLPDGTVRVDTWKVRGIRLDCPGRSARAVAARAPATVERVGSTFFVHYDD